MRPTSEQPVLNASAQKTRSDLPIATSHRDIPHETPDAKRGGMRFSVGWRRGNGLLRAIEARAAERLTLARRDLGDRRGAQDLLLADGEVDVGEEQRARAAHHLAAAL